MQKHFLLNYSYHWFKHLNFSSVFRKFYFFLRLFIPFYERTQRGENCNILIMCLRCTPIWIFSFKCTWCRDCTCHYRKGILSDSPQKFCKDAKNTPTST